MNLSLTRMAMLGLATILFVTGFAGGQQLPPPEPPKPMPGATQSGAPTLRVTTNEVLVPTLVEKRDGGILYGLQPADFVLQDNGVPQKIRVQEEIDPAPISLVVAVEEGGASVLEFGKLAKLGRLLDLFFADPRSQAALVGFDSKPHLIEDYTHSGEQLTGDLQHLAPGNGGASILDTVSYGVDLLESRPKDYRRVLLLISGARSRQQTHEAHGVHSQDRPIGCVGVECVVFAIAGRTAA